MKKVIDFRSDTVSIPPRDMVELVLGANVGDAVYNDDLTTIELEEYIAELLGKDAALFCPSGVFANQLAIMTHTNRSEELICIDNAHIRTYESGAIAALSGVNVKALESIKGKFSIEDLENAINPDDIHFAVTKLVCLENAHNGYVLDEDYINSVKSVCDEHGLLMHLDGARIFNAATALGCDVSDITKQFDSVSVCLSKGLASPVGSLLVGSYEFIEKARRYRKMMGGGMRQTGFLAAMGLHSLKVMSKRLDVDHDNAKYLAKCLIDSGLFYVDEENLNINLVFATPLFDIDDEFIKYLGDNNIKVNMTYGAKSVRFATHLGIEKEDIDKFIEVLVSYK